MFNVLDNLSYFMHAHIIFLIIIITISLNASLFCLLFHFYLLQQYHHPYHHHPRSVVVVITKVIVYLVVWCCSFLCFRWLYMSRHNLSCTLEALKQKDKMCKTAEKLAATILTLLLLLLLLFWIFTFRYIFVP